MNVIFVEPSFPRNQRQFVRALHATGNRVIGIGERPYDWFDDELKGWLAAYEQISSVTDEAALEAAVRRVQAREWVDRLEATVEAHVLTAAKVREATGIPGLSAQAAFLCRDKVAMKEALRQAGVPCAASAGVSSLAEAREFAEAAGFPLIVKPRSAAGASGTYRVDAAAELDQVLRESGVADGESAAIEEFITGHEGFYDTLTVDGQVRHDFISHYFPNVLEAMRTRWISPQIICTNRMDAEHYQQIYQMGRRVIEVLGITTAPTHMEWFFGPKGLRFSEIGARPPGVGQWDVYCYANDFDLFREWALAVTHGHGEAGPSRRYACGIIALRPDRDGQISHYDGADEIWQRFGDNIVAQHFPEPGTPTQGVEAGYMANAWMHVRDPDYDRLCEIMNTIGETIQVRAR
ncbi:MAG TPA: ATP-grasp domain-containing protein [Gammaproteobacteria bacterium]|nr:ATP-grasp domain-containing protein [Gammaproteobacteria bacterium]